MLELIFGPDITLPNGKSSSNCEVSSITINQPISVESLSSTSMRNWFKSKVWISSWSSVQSISYLSKLLLKTKTITSVSITLTNQRNRIIDLNGLNFDVSIKLDFVEVKDLPEPLNVREQIDKKIAEKDLEEIKEDEKLKEKKKTKKKK